MKLPVLIFGSLLVLYPVFRGTSALINYCPTRKFLTFNAALLDSPLSSGLPNNRLPRREAVISELRRLDADIVCLQEIWIGQDVERIVAALSGLYDYSYSKIHLPGKLGGYLPSQEGPSMPPCNYYDALAYGKCARRNKCLKKKNTQNQTYLCLNSHCYQIYEKIPQKCVTCLTGCWGRMPSVLKKCVGTGLPALNMRTINEPGLLLLSKRPLVNAKYADFHPYTKELIERGYIEADTGDLGKVVCTHITHNYQGYFEKDLSRKDVFKSYVEQGHSERTELMERFGHTYPLVLAGDFNTGGRFGPLLNEDLPEEFCHMARVFDVKPLQQCTLCWPHENIYTRKPLMQSIKGRRK